MTVIELLIALLIVAALTATAAPAMLGHAHKPKDSRVKQHLAGAYRVGKPIWRELGGYPPLGQNSDRAGTPTTLGVLREHEPVYRWSTNVDPASDRVIQVTTSDPEVVTYAAVSSSGTTFCLQVIERRASSVLGVAPGLYWSQGTGSVACGAPRALVAAGLPAAGGTSTVALPDPPYIIEDQRPYLAPGMLAVTSFWAKNATVVDGKLASNGAIQVGNSSDIDAIELGPGAPVPKVGSNSAVDEVSLRDAAKGPWVLGALDLGLTATTNTNALLAGQAGVGYDPTARSLTVASGRTVTFAAGVYNLCSISLGSNTTFAIAAGAGARIYLDSPDRPGSSCPPGSGAMTMGNNTQFNNPTGDPAKLQLYMYGYDNGSHTVTFNNQGGFVGAISAPRSKLIWTNAATVVGGIAASALEFKNGVDFTWVEALGDISSTPPAPYS